MACTGELTPFFPKFQCWGHHIYICVCVLLQPQDAYGLEKLASEELAKHYDNDFGIECRIAR